MRALSSILLSFSICNMRIGFITDACVEQLDWAKQNGFGSFQWNRFETSFAAPGKNDWRGEAERFASDPEHESIINQIVEDIIASGDRSAVVAGFFATLAGCSVACWRPEKVHRFRRHYELADKEFDEQLAALSRRYARITSLKPAA